MYVRLRKALERTRAGTAQCVGAHACDCVWVQRGKRERAGEREGIRSMHVIAAQVEGYVRSHIGKRVCKCVRGNEVLENRNRQPADNPAKSLAP